MNTLTKEEINTASHKELLKQYEYCIMLWGKYSCESFGYYIDALHKKIVTLGGWPTN